MNLYFCLIQKKETLSPTYFSRTQSNILKMLVLTNHLSQSQRYSVKQQIPKIVVV